MMMIRSKMIEFDEACNGFLRYITSNAVPWTNTEADSMNLLYLGHSADKFISPVLQRILDAGEVTSRGAQIRQSIGDLYGDKWFRLYHALVEVEYDPITNYDMTETSSDTHTGTNTDVNTGSTNSTAHSETDADIYGFNSVTSSKSDKTTTDGTSSASSTDNATHNISETMTHTLTRSGNIGVTTNTQMLEQEVNVRNRYLFWDIVFSDIDKIFTLPIY